MVLVRSAFHDDAIERHPDYHGDYGWIHHGE